MGNVSTVTVEGVQRNIKDLIARNLIPYITGTQAASTNAWTGVAPFASLSTGQVIVYHLPYAGTSSAATLNLTLSDGTTTGAKSIYALASTPVTTTFEAGCDILMVYNGTAWKVDAYAGGGGGGGGSVDWTDVENKPTTLGGYGITDANISSGTITLGENTITPLTSETYTGTVTSVRVQATSPVNSSVNTAQSTSLDTTISLGDAYGDTKNPYGSKTKNQVLAAPSNANGTPSFRALDASDIPDLSGTYLTSETYTGTVTSVQVQATSPVNSSSSAAQSTTLSTTISLSDAYGDTKNPYGTKTANYVLAGPTSGSATAPSFRALVAGDIPSITKSKISDFPTAVSSFTNDSGYVASAQTTRIYVQDSAPSSPVDGDIWIDTSQSAIPPANGENF